MLADPKAARALRSNTKQTLSRRRRMRQQAEFKQAFCAKRLTNKWFVVYVRKNESGFARLGIVASKKTMPKAASRNYAKRLVREVFRREFSAASSVDIVVRARQQISAENSMEGHLALAQLLQAVQA